MFRIYSPVLGSQFRNPSPADMGRTHAGGGGPGGRREADQDGEKREEGERKKTVAQVGRK